MFFIFKISTIIFLSFLFFSLQFNNETLFAIITRESGPLVAKTFQQVEMTSSKIFSETSNFFKQLYANSIPKSTQLLPHTPAPIPPAASD
ncbi:MAG: hypothetical protein HQK50_04345 [Oligoflexia bacterium]|nr:hypothetical protein [Oligoflexia bacterium]MBF0364775.1 hypothetical protein [Oligoflexia bacterium]